SGFPKCRYIKKEEKEEVLTGVKCPVCNEGEIVERVSKRGRSKGKKFYACNRYPTCKTTFTDLPTEEDYK
ncbi:MAG: topoisomerase DNA-binding C4 zinc finger domain-containing protein, partial [Bacilli bacterium]